MRTLQNFVAGRWTSLDGTGGNEVVNPATGEPIAWCPSSTEAAVDAAVAAARDAFPAWAATPVTKRAAALFELRHRLADATHELAEIMVMENGKTYDEAIGEMGRALEYVEHACAIPELLKGSVSSNVSGGVDTQYVREPLGVFAVVAPFNFPAMIPLYFSWAVACGNSVVVKPSELCPLTTVRIVELAERCGFPAGVVNVVLGGVPAVQRLVAHPDVAGVSFVGSSRAAEAVYTAASQHGKRAQCQGGAKNHLVVTESARLEACMPNLLNSTFGQASQRCFAGSNVLAVAARYEEVRDRFVAAAEAVRIGGEPGAGLAMGPVISRASLERARAAIENAIDEGAEILLDGRKARVDRPGGYWLGPTIIEAGPGMAVFDEELFGPVRCLKAVQDLDEAIEIVNRSPFGHSAVIYTESGGAAQDFARRVDVGQVGVNVGTPAPIAFYPVGGRKISFFGTLRGRANDAIDFYTDKKVIVSMWHAR
ncbi:MAG TPA: CoA-acylating methylmalonate-semialdehyde dehydrogenase [Actinomycetota bacterium]|nr:CoA-acylating methylmalonate-semialdehyde dehydrogenase [Actinomycetota bacterium]